MNRQIIIGLSALVAVLLLAVGAYFGVQRFTQTNDVIILEELPEEEVVAKAEEAPIEPNSNPGRVIQSIAIENGGAPVAIQTTILPAPELPDEPSAAFGVLVSREDDKLIVAIRKD